MEETQAPANTQPANVAEIWDDTHAEKMMTSMGVIKAIGTLVLSVQTSKTADDQMVKKATDPEAHAK